MSTTSITTSPRPFWPPNFTYFDVYGPIVLGGGFSCLLLGIIWITTYHYFKRFREDKLMFKIFMAILTLLTTVDTMMLWWEVGKLAEKPADFIYALQIQAGHLGWARSIAASLCAFLVQGYMIHTFCTFALALRYQDGSIWKKAALRAFGVVLALVALVGLVASCIAPVYADRLIKDISSAQKSKALSFTWQLQYGSMLGVDIILTVIFSMYLHTVRTGFSSSNSIISALMIILLRNGVLVTSLQLASLLLYTLSSSYWITFPGAFASKLYVLTVLSLVTKPRNVQRESMEKSLRRPPGISRPLSGSDNITLSRISNNTCQNCRIRILPVTSVDQQKSNLSDPRSPLSFAEFLNVDETNEITPTEDEKWLSDETPLDLARKGSLQRLEV